MSHTLWLDDAAGNHLALLDTASAFEYARVVNGVGAFALALPESFDTSLLKEDALVEIWRSPAEGAGLQLQMVGFIRRIHPATNEAGLTTYTVSGPDTNDLLRRRIVAYASGTSQAAKSGAADNVMKAIVREALGSSAGAGRDLSAYGFTVAVDLGLGPTVDKAFAWRNVLDVLKELADAAAVAGTAIYFDVVPASATAFEFQTFATRRGNDHSATSASPVMLGVAFGNFAQPDLDDDYGDEVTVAYAGGQGEGAGRVIKTATDTARLGASLWNRCEAFADARNETTDNGVTAVAQARLSEGKPKRRFGGNLVENPSFRYGIEWGFGDTLTATYRGGQYTAMVKALKVSVDKDGRETLSARLEVS